MENHHGFPKMSYIHGGFRISKYQFTGGYISRSPCLLMNHINSHNMFADLQKGWRNLQSSKLIIPISIIFRNFGYLTASPTMLFNGSSCCWQRLTTLPGSMGPCPLSEANPNGYRVEVLESVLDLNATVYVNSTWVGMDFPWEPDWLHVPGWWFGTRMLFFHILGRIIPTDSYFSEGLKPPTRYTLVIEWQSYDLTNNNEDWIHTKNVGIGRDRIYFDTPSGNFTLCELENYHTGTILLKGESSFLSSTNGPWLP